MDTGKQRMEKIYDKFYKEPTENEINQNFIYKPRAGDVIIFGPRKAGTTWMENILHQIRTKGDEYSTNHYNLVQFIGNPNRPIFNLNAEQKWNPRLYKAHITFGKIKPTNGVKQIFIIRDPYDTAYSCTKFVYRMFGGTTDMDDESMVKHMENEYTLGNNYFNLLPTWWPHRNDPDVFFVFYEDLKKDLKTMIKKIADFIVVNLNEDELRRVHDFCTFEFMTKNEKHFQPSNIVDIYNAVANGPEEKWEPTQSIVRKDGGQIGQGRQNLGPKVLSKIATMWAEKIEKPFGYKTYEELYQANSLF